MLGQAALLVGAAFLGVLAVYGVSRVLEVRAGSFRSRHRIWTHAVAAQFAFGVLIFGLGLRFPLGLFPRSSSPPTRPLHRHDLEPFPAVEAPTRGLGFEDAVWGLWLDGHEELSSASVPREERVPEQPSGAGGVRREWRGARVEVGRLSLRSALPIGIWLLGTVFLLGRLLVQQFRWWSVVRRWASAAPAALVACAEGVVATGQVRRRPRLIVGPLAVPAVSGMFRPLLLWPSSAVDMAEEDPLATQAILAHEIAHLHHRDPFWKLLAHVVTALLWWHPLVWWTRKRLGEVSEFAADETALLWGQDRVSLANGLLRFASNALAASSVAASGGPLRGSLPERVRHLLETKVVPDGAQTRQRLIVWTTALTVWLAGTGVAEVFPYGNGGSVMAAGLRFWRKAVVAAGLVGVSLGWQATATPGTAQEAPERQQEGVYGGAPQRDVEREVREATDRPRDGAEGEESREGALRREFDRWQAEEERVQRDIGEMARRLEAMQRYFVAKNLARHLGELREQLERLRGALQEAREHERDELVERLERQISVVWSRILATALAARSLARGDVAPDIRERIEELGGRISPEGLERSEDEIAELQHALEVLAEQLHRLALGPEGDRPREVRHRSGRRPGPPREILRVLRELRARREHARRGGREEEVRELEHRIAALERALRVREAAEAAAHGRHVEARERVVEFAHRLERAVTILNLAGLEDMAELLRHAGRERLERLQHAEHQEREELEQHEGREREELEEHEHREHEELEEHESREREEREHADHAEDDR